MNKLLLIILLTTFSFTSTLAQVKSVSYSTPFKEPVAKYQKVLQLKNGNTFFFNIFEDNLTLTIYNKEGKIAGKKKVSNDYINKKTTKFLQVRGLHEIAGEPVMFIEILVKRAPLLYRFRFDKDNGRVLEQKQIGTLPKYKITAGYAMVFGNVDNAGYSIYKDPNTDAYAQVNFNSFAKQTDKRIEVVHYLVIDGKHQQVNRSFYDVADFKYVNKIGLCVKADDVFVTAYAYNTAAHGGKDSRIIVSKLSKGNTTFQHKQIEYSEDFKDTKGEMLYNSKYGMIQLMTKTLTKNKTPLLGSNTTSYYMVMMHYIDPETLQIVKSIQLPVDGLQNIAQRVYDSKKGKFTGMPKSMVLQDDYSTTLLLEEETVTTSTRHSSGSGRTYTSTITTLGDAGVLNLTYKGEEKDAYVIPKYQIGKHEFFSYDLISVNGKQFFIFNEHWENIDITTPTKYKQIPYISETVAMYYQLQNGQMERKFLLGKNNGGDDLKFIAVGTGHFNKETNTYAALMVDKKGRKKQAHIVWIEFE